MAVVPSSLQLEEQHVSSISPIQVLLFFLSCLLGYSFSFIFLAERQESRSGKKYRSLVISNYLAVVPGIGLLTVSRRRVGETQLQPTRRKRERDLNLAWASLTLPSFPLHPSPPWGATATASHN